VTLEEAELLKRDLGSRPTRRCSDYFNWITSECVDPNNSVHDEETGETRSLLYRYVSLMGLVRSGRVLHGGVQRRVPPDARRRGREARGVSRFSAPATTRTQGSVLYGCRMVAFVHDEIILEMPDDQGARLQPCARHTNSHAS
jgi:hypothetical protein